MNDRFLVFNHDNGARLPTMIEWVLEKRLALPDRLRSLPKSEDTACTV
jgi:hypothetical protein